MVMRMNGVPLQCRVILANPNGLHMRPIAAIVELANHFESTITITLNGYSASARSILDLFGVVAEGGSELTLEADGPDAKQALDALAALLSQPPCDEWTDEVRQRSGN